MKHTMEAMTYLHWLDIKNKDRETRIIVPCDEHERHMLESPICPCNVRTQRTMTGTLVYIHQAFDHREVDEYYEAQTRTAD